jgi:hypothetical protein
MTTPILWKNVAVAMQSAIGATKTITGITIATDGTLEVASTSHGFVSGDYVLILASGMTEVNKRIFRVDNETSNTFELEGEDGTDYTAFTSGTAQKITFGTSIATMTTVNAGGGEPDQIDATTIHDTQRTVLYGLPAATSYTFDNIWDPSDAGLVALKSASNSQAERAFKFTFGAGTGGRIFLFYGQCSAGLNPTGTAQGLVTTSVSISATGASTTYSS